MGDGATDGIDGRQCEHEEIGGQGRQEGWKAGEEALVEEKDWMKDGEVCEVLDRVNSLTEKGKLAVNVRVKMSYGRLVIQVIIHYCFY